MAKKMTKKMTKAAKANNKRNLERKAGKVNRAIGAGSHTAPAHNP
jgi:hypothetical protein